MQLITSLCTGSEELVVGVVKVIPQERVLPPLTAQDAITQIVTYWSESAIRILTLQDYMLRVCGETSVAKIDYANRREKRRG